jgi:2-methylcitrate dehydratase PrpD
LYPSCGAVHPAVEAIVDVRRQLGCRSDVPPPAAMEVRVPPRVPLAMHFAWPSNPDEARFSLAYCIATAWRRGALEVGDFDEAAIATAAATPPPAWLTVVGDESFDPAGEQCRVTVELHGATATSYVQFRDGYPERPLSSERIEGKARTGLEQVFGPEHAGDVLAALSTDQLIHHIGPSTILETTAP